MSKYNEDHINRDELDEVARLIEILHARTFDHIKLDHIQLGDADNKIIGKLQNVDGVWLFHARRHDKPAQLGE